MKKTMTAFRHDSYTRARGKPSLLEITCEACGTFVAHYQKDGPGPLKRMYIDRILSPETWEKFAKTLLIKKIPSLTCSGCKEVLAIPIIYDKERRPALRLFSAAIKKKKVSLKKLSSKRIR